MNKIIGLMTALLLLIMAAPSGAAVPSHQQQFIRDVLAYSNNANESITQQREKLLTLSKQYQKHHKLSNKDQQWLIKLAKQYKVKSPSVTKPTTWQQLNKRVDIIPPSLIIAQAANESGWGTSRFARQGNNYFGQWCYTPGCGLVPKQRSTGQHHEVKKFKTPKDSIQSYMKNLNTNQAYANLRTLRLQQRKQQQAVKGLDLASGLAHYSQRGQAYVHSIQGLIKKYHLTQYDIS